jgi:hypothetical protein
MAERDGEAEYLDLDGDGVPDAVRTTSEASYQADGVDVVETVEELDRDIDDEGRPGEIDWTDTVVVDTDRDGAADLVEVTEIELRPDRDD